MDRATTHRARPIRDVASSCLSSLDNLGAALRGPACAPEVEEFAAGGTWLTKWRSHLDAKMSEAQLEVSGNPAKCLTAGGWPGGEVVAEEGRATNCAETPGNADLARR